MKGWLTVSVSGRFFSFSRPRPVSSRLTEATAFMESDPAVAAGVMTATVHPYAVVLQRSEK